VSNRKNYNSIFFLTVYLGLVLVGATPQVLAQAAMTRQFDIKTEIVVEDDLDKKPDDESCQSNADNEFIEHYATTVVAFLKKNYATQVDNYDVNINFSYSSEDNDALISDYFPSLRKDIVIDKFNYRLDKKELLGKLNLKSKYNNDISHINKSFLSSLNSLRLNLESKPENTILKNTEVSFENNQVFIVTRLPRGSIDDLLKEKDAQ